MAGRNPALLEAPRGVVTSPIADAHVCKPPPTAERYPHTTEHPALGQWRADVESLDRVAKRRADLSMTGECSRPGPRQVD